MNAYYRQFESPTAGGVRPAIIHCPVADVRIFGPTGNELYQGRLDTGASETSLPWTAVDRLGVQLLPGRAVDIEGVGGSVVAMFGWVDFEFHGSQGLIRWSHLCVFTTSHHTLFGLRGFLEYFVARFDGVKHDIRLQFRGKAPRPGSPRRRRGDRSNRAFPQHPGERPMNTGRRHWMALLLGAITGGLTLTTTTRAAAGMTFEIYKDAKGEFRWRLKASNGQIVATGGQGYSAKADCKHAIESIMKNAATATVEDHSAKA